MSENQTTRYYRTEKGHEKLAELELLKNKVKKRLDFSGNQVVFFL